MDTDSSRSSAVDERLQVNHPERSVSMLSRPRFRPHFHVEVVPGEGVFLLSDSRQSLLRGRLYELVVPWLDGRTTDDVCDRLRGKASPAEVYYTLAQLERKDFLCEQEESL